MGYPDMGCGRYAAKLSDADWLLFNNAQRAHYNFVEGVATYILLILAAGLYYPLYATYLGIAIFVGRLVFAMGYVSKGPMGRLAGALLVDFALLGLVGLSVMSGLHITKGKTHA
jgi:glutathione S-transferase